MHAIGMIAVGKSSVLFAEKMEAEQHSCKSVIPCASLPTYYTSTVPGHPLMLHSAQIYWYVGILLLPALQNLAKKNAIWYWQNIDGIKRMDPCHPS